jgi:hypothetical protein
VNTAHEHKPGTPRAEWVARLLCQLSDRVFAGGDAFARENGWQITKTTGRFGFGARAYRDPRFAHRNARDHLQVHGWAERPLPPDTAPASMPLQKGAGPP